MSINFNGVAAIVGGGLIVGGLGLGVFSIVFNLARTDNGVSIGVQTGIERRQENLEAFQRNFPLPETPPPTPRQSAPNPAPQRLEPFISTEPEPGPKCDRQPGITYLDMQGDRLVHSAVLEPPGTRVFQIGASPALQGKRVSLKLKGATDQIEMALSGRQDYGSDRISQSICDRLREPPKDLQFTLSSDPQFLFVAIAQAQSVEIILEVIPEAAPIPEDSAGMAIAPREAAQPQPTPQPQPVAEVVREEGEPPPTEVKPAIREISKTKYHLEPETLTLNTGEFGTSRQITIKPDEIKQYRVNMRGGQTVSVKTTNGVAFLLHPKGGDRHLVTIASGEEINAELPGEKGRAYNFYLLFESNSQSPVQFTLQVQ